MLSLRTSSATYDIVVETGCLHRAGALAAQHLSPGRCVIITDANVEPLYAQPLHDSLTAAGFSPRILTVPAGERSKSLEQAAELCEEMISAGLDRKSSVFALGGGVVGDLAGFVASIYYRGIPVVQVPTTIIAQVDSSIGGKTGVNARGGKNLIGAFHQPRLVVSDPALLTTLPPREYREGFAEIIKHAAIRDAAMLEMLDSLAPDSLEELVARNAAIKARVVEADEFETTGERAHLNFGHTLGHAIENAAGYGTLLHGEAISIGLAGAVFLSQELAGLSAEEADRILAALQKFHLPISLPTDMDRQQILHAMKTDKKFASGAIRFVLVPKLGEAVLSDQVTLAHIEAALDRLSS